MIAVSPSSDVLTSFTHTTFTVVVARTASTILRRILLALPEEGVFSKTTTTCISSTLLS